MMATSFYFLTKQPEKNSYTSAVSDLVTGKDMTHAFWIIIIFIKELRTYVQEASKIDEKFIVLLFDKS